MKQEESELFQITITEAGKKQIRKFAAISLIILLFGFFVNGVTIYWNVKALIARANRTGAYIGYTDSSYYRFIPYILIGAAILLIISYIFYIRFPRELLNSINTNNEFGANKSFGTLLKAACLLLVYLVISTATIIWSFFAL